MEITTLDEYLNLVWGAPSVDALSDKAWYDIAMYAQDGFVWDMELVKLVPRPLPNIPKNICATETPLSSAVTATTKTVPETDKKAEELLF